MQLEGQSLPEGSTIVGGMGATSGAVSTRGFYYSWRDGYN